MSHIHDKLLVAGDVRAQPEARKPYVRPRFIRELDLETRAGSPLIIEPQEEGTLRILSGRS